MKGLLVAAAFLPAYAQECGSCHVPYAPGLLPASSWTRILSTLDRHYGTDASLDEATRQGIQDWLIRQAAQRGKRTEVPPEDRITRATWFQREHRKALRAGGKPASQCGACHAGADRGIYEEER